MFETSDLKGNATAGAEVLGGEGRGFSHSAQGVSLFALRLSLLGGDRAAARQSLRKKHQGWQTSSVSG